MAEASTPISASRRSSLAAFVLAAAMGLAMGVSGYTFYRVVELTDETTDPAIWGKNFPCGMTATGQRQGSWSKTHGEMSNLTRSEAPACSSSCVPCVPCVEGSQAH